MDVFTEIRFEAAHLLPHVPAGHKCGRLHGHSYRVEVHVAGPVDPGSGMVVDFADIKAACAPVRDRLDHYYLNEIDGLDNPTSENLARWIWARLSCASPALAGMLSKIVVRETCTSGVEYRGGATDE